MKIRTMLLATAMLAIGAVAGTATPATAAPATHAASAHPGAHARSNPAAATADPNCLWFSDLFQQGNVVVADVESPCGDQVNLTLYRDGVIVADLCCAQAIQTTYSCASTAPVTWGLNTGLSLVTNCTTAIVPNVVGINEFRAIEALANAG